MRGIHPFRTAVVAVLLLMAVASVAAAGPVLLFDQGHGQRFTADKEGSLQLSGFAGILKEEGFDVRVGTTTFSAETLSGVDALVISGPFAPLQPAETEAVLAFVARGGRLALMLHIPMPVENLLHLLEVDYSNYVISEQEHVIEGDRRNFRLKNLASHPLFASIDSFSLYGGWALMNIGTKSRVIASTTEKAWADLNGDGRLSTGDAIQEFSMVMDGSRDAGRFVVFGDDAVFQNKFLDQQNRQLARNLANWLK